MGVTSDIHRSASLAAHYLVDGIAHGQPAYARAPDHKRNWSYTRGTLAAALVVHELTREATRPKEQG